MDEIIWNESTGKNEAIARYQTDCRLALIRRDGEGNLQRVLFYGGKYLKDESRDLELVASDTTDIFVDVDYLQNKVFLDGAINGQIRVRGKDISMVSAGNRPVPFRKSGAFIIINADQLPPATPTGIQIQVR